MEDLLNLVKSVVDPVKAKVFSTEIKFRVELDAESKNRVFIQPYYSDFCRATSVYQEWRGRKWYLSKNMTRDEVIKTCYAAFKACVEHEIMEGFSYNGELVFNPHTPFYRLIEASKEEVSRETSKMLIDEL